MNTYFYILLLAFLPLVYKIWFWLYVVQLKEYRFDRIYDYLKTPQWKKAIFNILFYIELVVLSCGILFFLEKISQNVMFNIFVFFLQFESLFVFYKLLKKWLFLPKKTTRVLILAWIVILGLFSIFWSLYFYQTLLYVVLPSLFVLFPLYVLFWNFITSPFFDYKKEQIFNKAWEKTKKLKTHIFWITWSFGKSSMKEFLAELLSCKYNVLKTPKNINTEIWISNLILQTDFSKYDYFVSEMWAYRKWEIKRSWEILNYKDAFVVGIWNQHIWLFGSQQNILEAKFEAGYKVLENNWKLYVNVKLKPKNWKILLNEKEYVKYQDDFKKIKTDDIERFQDDSIMNFKWINYDIPEIYQKLLDNKQVVFYWNIDEADYRIKIQKVDVNWTYFRFYQSWKDLFDEDLFVKVLWKGQLENLAWALAYLFENEFSKEEVKNCLKNIKQIDKTLKITVKDLWNELNNEKVIYIDDSYNLPLNGLLNGVNLMNDFSWTKILVMDDILELWKDAWNIHYELWKQLACKIDKLFFVWINYKKNIVQWLKDAWFSWEILEKFPSYFVEATVVLFEGKKAWRYMK